MQTIPETSSVTTTGPDLIRRLAALIQEAITVHIYDEGNGDVIDPDSPYVLAVAEAEAFLKSNPADFSAPPIGLLEIADDLAGAVASLQHQLDQVGQLHSYTDDDVVAAHEEGDEACKRLDLYRKATDTGVPQIAVWVNGGTVQDVTLTRPASGFVVIVIDGDTDGEADHEAITMVQDCVDKDWTRAVVVSYPADNIPVGEALSLRPATPEDMA